MTIGIDFPEEIARQLAESWGDLSGRAREAVIVEGYRSGALSQAQVRQLLGLGSDSETDGFLKGHGIFMEYGEEDLFRDLENSRKQRAK